MICPKILSRLEDLALIAKPAIEAAPVISCEWKRVSVENYFPAKSVLDHGHREHAPVQGPAKLGEALEPDEHAPSTLLGLDLCSEVLALNSEPDHESVAQRSPARPSLMRRSHRTILREGRLRNGAPPRDRCSGEGSSASRSGKQALQGSPSWPGFQCQSGQSVTS